MGHCWCKDMAPNTEVYAPARPSPQSQQAMDPRVRMPKVVEPVIVDRLILEMLTLISTFVDNEEESPVCLVKLHVIADSEEGWIQVVTSMVNVVPLKDPFGPSAITILLDDCPLPSKDLVLRLMHKIFKVSLERANMEDLDVRVERNICVVLGCMAEKLAGPNSIAILTGHILNYLYAFLESRVEPRIVLFALIALEKFAHTTENKLEIKSRLDMSEKNPLLELEKMAVSDNYWWRQVGFCAKWALDNVFIVEGRKLSYEEVDMSNINVILNNNDVSEYLKISCDGLEARCDSYSFESVRCTFQVDEGAWYYEAEIITPGVMQIGWATKNSHFLNHEGYGIGDDLYSVSYDGCRRLVWYKAKPTRTNMVPPWKEGDILGCLIDIDKREAIFYQNGHRIHTCSEIFNTIKHGFFAAASFMAFQQCRFNFGSEPFKFPPKRNYQSFNEFGELTDEQKKMNDIECKRHLGMIIPATGISQVVPRRIYLEQLRYASFREDSCTLCFDDTGCCILEPCGHRGFCSLCTSQLKECPLCRSAILNVRREPA